MPKNHRKLLADHWFDLNPSISLPFGWSAYERHHQGLVYGYLIPPASDCEPSQDFIMYRREPRNLNFKQLQVWVAMRVAGLTIP